MVEQFVCRCGRSVTLTFSTNEFRWFCECGNRAFLPIYTYVCPECGWSVPVRHEPDADYSRACRCGVGMIRK